MHVVRRVLAVVCWLVLTVSAPLAQESKYLREGSIGRPTDTPPTDCPQEPLQFRHIECWKGERVIFLPRPKSLQEFGYQSFEKISAGKKAKKTRGYSRRPTYAELVGRIAVVESVKVGKGAGWDLTIRMADGEDRYVGHAARSDRYEASLSGVALVSDLDACRERWLGNTVWYAHKFGPEVYDATTDQVARIELPKFTPVKIIDIVAGWHEYAPVRFVLRTPDGRTAFSDLNPSGSGAWSSMRPLVAFETFFRETDPRMDHDWSDRVWDAIAARSVFIGMTAEQARMSWGEPEDVNRTVIEGESKEQWVYAHGGYVYLSNGVVSAIQN